MNEEWLGPRARTAPELKAQIEAERQGRPFLVYRDAEGEQRILVIGEDLESLWVGRSASADLNLSWTPRPRVCTRSSTWSASSARSSTTASRGTARS